MAKLKRNGSLVGLSGLLGKQLVFRQMPDGSTVVSTAPDFTDRVLSKKQLDHQSRFQQASAYARVAAKTHPLYREIAQSTGKVAYRIALSDWFHAPRIEQITRQGQRLLVHATDNVQVAQVRVTVCGEDGRVLEQGQALPAAHGRWDYSFRAEGRILVEAMDLPGNVACQEIGWNTSQAQTS
jgi:hypothetical protein